MSGSEPTVDLTQERYNRFARALESLFEHQKSLATLVAGGQRDLGQRLLRVKERLTAVELALREFRTEQASQMNQILNAQQTALRTDMRLDELEHDLKAPGSDA